MTSYDLPMTNWRSFASDSFAFPRPRPRPRRAPAHASFPSTRGAALGQSPSCPRPLPRVRGGSRHRLSATGEKSPASPRAPTSRRSATRCWDDPGHRTMTTPFCAWRLNPSPRGRRTPRVNIMYRSLRGFAAAASATETSASLLRAAAGAASAGTRGGVVGETAGGEAEDMSQDAPRARRRTRSGGGTSARRAARVPSRVRRDARGGEGARERGARA